MPAWAALGLAGLVGMAESGAVVSSATPGESYPTSGVFGIGRLTSPLSTPHTTLRVWAALARSDRGLPGWLLWHLAFSCLFVAGYLMLLSAGLCVLARRGTPVRRMVTGWLLLLTTGILNLALIAAAAIGIAGWIGRQRDPGAVWAVVLQVLAIVTWAFAIWLIGWLCYRGWDQRSALRRLARAAEIQRFSLVIAVVLLVVAILPGPNALEQMPDVQREWLGHRGVTWSALLAAIAAQVLLAFLMFQVGRLRIRRARQRAGDEFVRPRAPEPHYRGWLITAAAVLAAAGVLRLFDQARVSWAVAVIPAVLCAVAAASFVAGRVAGPAVPAPDLPAGPAQDVAATVVALGDGLAVAVLAIPGLGLVRSFTTPALVAGGSYSGLPRLAVLLGVLLAVLIWPLALLARLADRRLNSPVRRRLAPRSDFGWPATLTVGALVFGGAVVWLLRWPLQASARLGVVGTATVALGALAMILAVLAHLAQNREPLPLFSLLRLKTTPVLSILAVVGILGLAVGANSGLHLITTPSSPVTPVIRPSLRAALATWLAAPAASCVPDVARAADGQIVQVRPLVLVAAAGGGIRAAWWTADALTTLADNGCGRQSVFAVSGVSGGALGTAVVATATGQGSSLRGSVLADLDRLAQPAALASGIDGFVLRDTVAGLTGVELRAAAMRDGPQFPDRAALMEQAWIDADRSLAGPFLAARTASVPWQLLFNSTAVRTSCRAIIATSYVGAPGQPAQYTPSCLGISGQSSDRYDLPDAYDLFSRLPCLQHLSMATAAMLSARFAYITPSGDVPGCAGYMRMSPASQLVEQYIDGGYLDSTGLLTLADVLPSLLPLIARHNAAELAGAGTGGAVTLTVPVVVYLGNTAIVRPVSLPAPLPQAAEPAIPLHAGSSAEAQVTGRDVLLQQVAAQISPSRWLPCAASDSQCLSAVAAAGTVVRSGIVVVAPRQEPGDFAVPLGWVLSQASQQNLTSNLSADAARPCGADGIYCSPGTQDLRYLLALTRPRPAP